MSAKTILDRKLQPKGDLGRRLLALCDAKGYASLAEAAESSGINYMQLYQLITGSRDPRWSTVERIVGLLGGNMDDLFQSHNPNYQKVSLLTNHDRLP